MRSIRTLGLDVSSNSTGWAFMEDDDIIDFGMIKTSGKDAEKLHDYYSQLYNIMEEHADIKVDWVGIEDTYVFNASLTKLLSRYCGVTMNCCYMAYGISEILHKKDCDFYRSKKNNPRSRTKLPERGIYMPTPNEVFTWLGVHCPSDRAAKKQEAIDWVRHNLYKELSMEQNDIADAICIAFATKEMARDLSS